MGNLKILHLKQLADLAEALTPVQRAYYVEAGIIALENQEHQPGVKLNIDGDIQDNYQLEWEKFSYSKSGWKEPREIAENGSIAIGILLILELTEYQVVEQSVIGTGFDFWLGYKENHENYDPDNFLNARLEISGINKGSRAEIIRRLRDKLRQLSVSDYLKLPGYVIITEFGNPVSLIIKK